MDWVNQGALRLSQLIQSMSPAARLLAALSLAAVLASAGWRYAQHPAPGATFLMGGQSFSAAQLRDMESALGRAGLADYEVEGGRLRVPHGQQAKYMAALAEAGALPSDFGAYLRKAVDTSGFLLSGSRQQAQLKVAVQSDLQDLINNFDGIESSFVQIAEETGDGFSRKKTVTASVGIKTSSPDALDERSVTAIRCMVASAWGGLKPESVTVADLRTRRVFAGPLPTGPTATDFAQTRRKLEADWQEKISRALGIPGAIVTTSVELDTDGQSARRVSAAIAVPQAHYNAIWQQQYGVPPEGRTAHPDAAAFAALQQTESQRIKNAIAPLLGATDVPSADPLVAVSTIYPQLEKQPGSQNLEAALREWFSAQWQNLGLSALVVVGVMLLWSTLRTAFRQQTTPTAVKHPEPTLALITPDEPVAPAKPATPPPLMPAALRQSELADRVRQDPQAAASVLRNWIGNAS